MKINRLALKNNTKRLIAENKFGPVTVAMVYYLLSLLLSYLVTRLTGYSAMMYEMLSQAYKGNFAFTPSLPQMSPVPMILTLALALMALVLSAGFTIYSLRVCQRQKAGARNLLDGFGIFSKLILMEIVIGIFVFLWSLLFVIPGIVAAYRYRQALYILIDDPSLGVMECVRRSKAMMRGRKWELFVIDLSFLGWDFLTSFCSPVAVWYWPYSSICYAYYYIALRDMPGKTNNGFEAA